MAHQPSKKIAFIRMGPFPYANETVAQVLGEVFPEFDVEIIDIVKIIKNRKDIIFINTLYMLKEYGPKLLLGHRRAWNCFFTTSYIFKKIKNLVANLIKKDNYIFTFQMQSLFDASVPRMPHFVYTDHTFLTNLEYADFNQRQMPSNIWLELEKTIYHNATCNFVRSKNVARTLLDQYDCDADHVRCVYIGTNAQISKNVVDNANYSNKNILFVGMDWHRKGGPELVEAFKIVLETHPDAHLTIVGCTPQLDLPNCEIAGRVPLSEVHRYFEKASVFCLPTKLEPFGVVFIEALHHQLPIVATNIGAVPDFVTEGENGYLVSPASVIPLAQALIDLVGDPQKCQRFGDQSSRIAMARYQWEKVGARIKEHITAGLARAELPQGSK